MSLSFNGPKGSIEQRWIYYALLRDNVQHHIEGGQPSQDFECLHRISDALAQHRVTVPARKLHAELLRAKAVLCPLPATQLAISARTRAVLSLRWPPPEARATMLVSEWGGSVPLLGTAGTTLDEVFGHLLDQLISVTEAASESDVVTIIDL